MTIHSKKPRILIADDNSVMRDLIKAFYEDYDFELIEAVNGNEVVAKALAYRPDLILLDIQMPGLNGYEAAAILKNEESVKDIPLVVVTGEDPGDVALRMSGMNSGFLSKPFKKADLIQATMQCLPNIRDKNGDIQKENV